MKDLIALITLISGVLIIMAGRSDAVICGDGNEKGDLCLVDDLQKVPEQDRPSARMVNGQVMGERSDEERLRDAAKVAALRQERSALQGTAERSQRSRLLWSGAAAAAVIVMFVIIANVDALKQQRPMTDRLRMVLIALFVLSW